MEHQEYHINNSIVKIIFGDILKSETEVIVNSSGSGMTMGGGLTELIRKAGGEVIKEDAQSKLPVNVGDVVVTTAGKLRQKYVFHCITIDKSFDHQSVPKNVSENEIHQNILGHAIDNCFRLLHAMDLNSIAFPAIGAGGAKIPIARVAEVMAKTIAKSLMRTKKSLQVEIYLLDLYGTIGEWGYLPMFEQFSAQEAVSKMLNDQSNDRLIAEDFIVPQTSDISIDTNKDVFISYSRKDIEIVRSIYEWLEKAGCQCWLDLNGMLSGVSYKKVIVEAINRSKVMLFMSSENSNKSRNVVSEVSIAMSHDKKIIPVRLDMSPYSESIEYDIINHDFVVYDKSRSEDSNKEVFKRVISTLKM